MRQTLNNSRGVRLPLIAALAVALLACWTTLSAQENQNKSEKKSPPEAVQLYADAANFQNNGAYELAVEEWGKFLERYPDDPLAVKARHYLGVCHLQRKQLDKAVEAFAAVLAKQPDFEYAEDAYLNLGWCRYSLAGQGKPELYAEASATLKTLVDKYPKGKYADQAYFFLGDSLYYQDQRAAAVEAYDALVKGFPKSTLRSNGLYALGVTLEELGRHEEAAQAYDKFLAEFARHDLFTEVRMRKAETLLQAGDVAGAEKIFAETAAVENFSLADHALFRQAYCAAKQDKFAEAAALYAKVPAQFPKSEFAAEATLSAGRCFYRADRLPEATEWLKKSVAGGGAAAPEAAHWLCRILMKRSEHPQIVALADEVLPSAGESEFLVNLLMDKADALYEMADRREEALALYLKIAADHGDHSSAPQALYNAAFAALQLQQYAAGLEHAQAFSAKHADDVLAPDAAYVAAECQLQLGEHAKSEELYRKLLDSHPQHAEADLWRVRLGLCLSLQKKHQEAIDFLAPIAAQLKSNSQQAEAHYLVGASQFALGKFSEASQALAASQAASADWSQADEALLLLARSYGELSQWNEATAALSKLLESFPQSPHLDHAYYRLGEYRYAQDQFEPAVAAYGEVVQKWPQSSFAPYSLYGAGWAQLKAKQYPQAVQSFTALLDKHAEHQLAPEAAFSRGMALRQQGKHQEAIADVETFLKSQPAAERKSSALYERGLAEVALQQYDRAEQTFAALLAENAGYAGADKAMYELAWAQKSQNKNDLAVATFAALAEKFPDSSTAAEAHFHVGESRYEKEEYEAAAAAHASAKQKAGRGELGEKAGYKLGWSLYQLGQYPQALEQFREQVETYPEGGLLADGLFMQAECLFKLENYDAALPVYTTLKSKKLATPQAEALVLLHGGQAAAQQKQWSDSLEFLAAIFERFPESPYLAEARYEQGWAKQNLGQGDEALKDYEAAAESSRDKVGARARFMMGELYFERKEYDEAIRQFQRVTLGFGGESAAADVKKWQAMAGYEAARCAEVQIQAAKDDASKRAALIADAKKYYAYVTEKHPDSEVAPQAKQRLAALEKLP